MIARPFVGSPEEGFTRTGNRKDFAIPPPDETILDRLKKKGRKVVTIGSADRPGRVFDAIHSAFFAGRQL